MRFASDARLAFGLLALSVLALAAFVVVGFGDLPSRALRSPSADPPPAPPTAGAEFVDITEAVGLGGFEHELRYGVVQSIADAVAPGVGLLDLDDDGDLDLVLIGGPGAPVGVSIYANRLAERHELRFENVTEKAGIVWHGAAQGICAGDVDMDGDIDLFITAIGGNLLLRSLFADSGELAFVDATEDAGLLGGRWYWTESADRTRAPTTRPGTPPPELGDAAEQAEHVVSEFSTGATFGDVDCDGDLDLYVANYVSYFEKRYEMLRAADPNGPDRSGEPIQFQPKTFEPQPDRLYYNELADDSADLLFRDVTRQAQATDAGGRGLGVVFMRIDNDVYPDVYVANDASQNIFLHNVPVTAADPVDFKRRFEDATVEFGLDDDKSGMGIARGDADGDGDIDLLTTNWRHQSASLFLFGRETKASIDGTVRLEPTFVQGGNAAGLKATSRWVGWGCVFFDYDNDRDEDLFVGNGFTSPRAGTLSCTPETPMLFRNDGAGHFVDVTSSAGSALARTYSARGVVTGDIDQDGDLDLIIAQNSGPIVVLENRLPANGNRSLTYLVSFAPRRGDAVNAQVVADVGGRKLVQELLSGGSYLSQGPFEAHFGLGQLQSADRVQITWPWTAGSPRVMVLREELSAGRHRVTWAPPEPR